MTQGPVIIELDGAAEAKPDQADTVPELGFDGAAMTGVMQITTKRRSRLARWLWSAFVALFTFVVGLAAWDYVVVLLARSPALGGIASVLIAVILGLLLVVGLREYVAFRRLRRLDRLQADAARARSLQDLPAAQNVAARLGGLYKKRPEMRWGLDGFQARQRDAVDADTLLDLAEQHLMQPLDQDAIKQIEAATRQVATVTALVPIALADVVTALVANLRMIRRIAEIYGGRAGTLGSWRLIRTVMTHLVATGAVAIGDDLIGSVAGGSVVSKISRRFGEGIVNGALTARVGVAAIEVCRPLPFAALPRPSVGGVVKRGLSGVFSRG